MRFRYLPHHARSCKPQVHECGLGPRAWHDDYEYNYSRNTNWASKVNWAWYVDFLGINNFLYHDYPYWYFKFVNYSNFLTFKIMAHHSQKTKMTHRLLYVSLFNFYHYCNIHCVYYIIDIRCYHLHFVTKKNYRLTTPTT